jgi:hypothetical protein
VFAPVTAAAAPQSTASATAAAAAAAQSQAYTDAVADDAGLDNSSSVPAAAALQADAAAANSSSVQPPAGSTTAAGVGTATAAVPTTATTAATAAAGAAVGASQGTTPLLQRGNTVSSAVGFGGVMRAPVGVSPWTDLIADDNDNNSCSNTAHRGGLLGALYALVRRFRGSATADDSSEEVSMQTISWCCAQHYVQCLEVLLQRLTASGTATVCYTSI